MADKRLVDVVRGTVADLHPEELPDFDRIVEVWNNDPKALRLARKPRDEPAAAGVTSAIEFFASVAMDVGVDVCAGLVTAGLVTTAKKGLRLLKRRRPDVGTETIVPPIDEAQVPEMEAFARSAALARGVPSEEAGELARTLVALWARK